MCEARMAFGWKLLVRLPLDGRFPCLQICRLERYVHRMFMQLSILLQWGRRDPAHKVRMRPTLSSIGLQDFQIDLIFTFVYSCPPLLSI